LTFGLGPYANPLSIAVDPARPSRVYAVVYTQQASGIFVSSDGGLSWRFSSPSALTPAFVLGARPLALSDLLDDPPHPVLRREVQ
jgi:hypothetical protein